KMLMPPPADEQAAMQMRMMKYTMIFMGLIFYKMPSGLCVYFIASSLWGFAERKLLPKKKPTTDGVTVEAIPAPAPPPAASVQGMSSAPAGNRTRRRQERKRRQERAAQLQAQSPAPSATREEPAPRPEQSNGESWWTGLRRRIGDWWKDVLKRAAKK